MPRKGMSLDEKRQKILEIYHSTETVFNLKEITKIASKKGVSSMSIPDVNTGLVDDSLINCEKIGSGNFFWSFPSEKLNKLQTRMRNANEEITKEKEKKEELENEYEKERKTRVDNEERKEKLNKIKKLEEKKNTLKRKIEALKENDPDLINGLADQTEFCRQQANRWTDNIYQLENWLVKKKGRTRKEADKFLHITDAFDYI